MSIITTEQTRFNQAAVEYSGSDTISVDEPSMQTTTEQYNICGTDGIYLANFGRFILRSAFQPIYAVVPDALSLYAYEALVRPEIEGSTVYPSELFNPSSGYDLAALDRLCRSIHIRNYKLMQNSDATLFLNINPAHFIDDASVDAEFLLLINELQNHGIAASKVVCEIIETEAADDTLISRVCEQLREFGVKIAVDDYGSDHSDWARFELVQPDILKLDGPVFRNLCKTPAAVQALKKLTDSLHEIGCVLLVEGVETRNQFDITIEAGVSLIQGYFLGKPEKTTHQFPRIPTAAFLPGQNIIHHSQVFLPTISFQEISDPTQ